MRISYWSSDVCSSDLPGQGEIRGDGRNLAFLERQRKEPRRIGTGEEPNASSRVREESRCSCMPGRTPRRRRCRGRRQPKKGIPTMRTLRRTVSTIALVGTVSLALSACGWFRGDEEAATTGTTTTMTDRK